MQRERVIAGQHQIGAGGEDQAKPDLAPRSRGESRAQFAEVEIGDGAREDEERRWRRGQMLAPAPTLRRELAAPASAFSSMTVRSVCLAE